MATLFAGTLFPVDNSAQFISIADLSSGVVTSATGTLWRIEYANGVVSEIEGTGLTYSTIVGVLVPTGGTLTNWENTLFGSRIFRLEGFSLPAADMVAFLLADDIAGLAAALFADGDLLLGAFFDDTLLGYGGDDTIFGGGGNDSLIGGSGNDYLVGQSDQDTLESGGGLLDVLEGGAGNDLLQSTGGTTLAVAAYIDDPGPVFVDLLNQTATDGFGNTDTLSGINGATVSAFNDTVVGSNAAEVFTDFGGQDDFTGGGGSDWIVYHYITGPATVDLSAGTGFTASDSATDTLTGFSNIFGTQSADTLTGDTRDNIIHGNAGADTLDGGSNPDLDYVWGRGAGRGDTLFYSNPEPAFVGPFGVTVNLGTATSIDTYGDADVLIGGSFENIVGSAMGDMLTGDNRSNIIEGGAGNDTLDGGGATNMVSHRGDRAAVSVDLALGTATDGFGGTDMLSNFAHIEGSDFDDTLTGNGADNLFLGLRGADTITGGGGNDTISYFRDYGLFEFGGRDRADPIIYGGAIVNLAMGKALDDGSGEQDTLIGIRNVIGSSFGDMLTGDGQDNRLDGLGGADRLEGGLGADTLEGGSGADTLLGQGGNDTIFGDIGNDSLIGGAGYDSLSGGDGEDTLESGGGFLDVLGGGAGNDLLKSTDGTTLTMAGYFNDLGPVFVDLLNQTATDSFGGTDTLDGINGAAVSVFNDTVIGSAAAEVITDFGGQDDFSGGGGSDWIVYQYIPGAAAVDLSAGTGFTVSDGATDILDGFANIFGSLSTDTLIGDSQDNVIYGNAGTDTLDGGSNPDLGYVQGRGPGRGDTLFHINLDPHFVGPFGVTVNLGTATSIDAYGDTNVLVAGSFENIVGSRMGDMLTGDAGPNIIEGSEGNDTLDGGGGMNMVSHRGDRSAANVDLALGTATDGFGGTDILSNFSHIEGSDFDDTLTGNGADNLFFGLRGADTITGGGGNDTVSYFRDYSLFELGGRDRSEPVLYGGATVNLTMGKALNDGSGEQDTLIGIRNVIGSSFGDILTGDGQDNRLDGLGGADRLEGGLGADTLEGSSGADTLDGGDGIDTASYAHAASGIDTKLKPGSLVQTGDAAGDVYISIENLIGSDFSDRLVGSNLGNWIDAGDGDDGIWASFGDDTVLGGDGRDRLYGQTGNDSLVGGDGWDSLFGREGLDTLEGGAGNDTLDGGADADTLDGGDGRDTASYASALSGIDTKLKPGTLVQTGDAAGDVYISIEDLVGSAYNDRLVGSNIGNRIDAGDGDDGVWASFGDDTVLGGGGRDRLYGQTGDDSLVGGDGWDSLFGREGADTLRGDAGNDTLDGGADADLIDGGDGRDTASYASAQSGIDTKLKPGTLVQTGDAAGDIYISIEDLVGSAYGDRLVGSNVGNRIDAGAGDDGVWASYGDDTVMGGAGRDRLFGQGGNDSLAGGSEADSLFGRDGLDTLEGGSGNDTLEGGADADLFVFAALDGRDTVSDFEDGLDLIGLAGGLTFSDLTISAGASGAEIAVTATAEILAVLVGIDSADVTGADFTLV